MNASTTNPILPLVGRLLMGLLFLVYGVVKITSIPGTAGYMGKLGLPAPELFAYLAAIIELAGGLMIIVGWQTRRVAWFLMVYTLIATGLAHRFWEYSDPGARGANMANFFKNLAIMGGFFFMALFGPGSASIDKS